LVLIWRIWTYFNIPWQLLQATNLVISEMFQNILIRRLHRNMKSEVSILRLFHPNFQGEILIRIYLFLVQLPQRSFFHSLQTATLPHYDTHKTKNLEVVLHVVNLTPSHFDPTV
jgi:hypothetical protein